MTIRYISAAALLLAVCIFIAGCGGGGSTAPTLTQRLQGEWAGTVNDPSHPDAAKCDVTITGSDVEGEVQSEDGTVIGTINGTVDDEGNINVEFEYDGQPEGETGTIAIDDETGEVGIDIEDNGGGEPGPDGTGESTEGTIEPEPGSDGTGEGGEAGGVADGGDEGPGGETGDGNTVPEITLQRK